MTPSLAHLLLARPVFGSLLHLEALRLLVALDALGEAILEDPDGLGIQSEEAIFEFWEATKNPQVARLRPVPLLESL